MKRNFNEFDLHGTLELLHTNPDLDVQVKLLSLLSAYVMLNDANIEVIITCNHVYAKLSNVLSKSTARKAAIGLNFLSALLYVDMERSKENLAIYAKNMIRASGCLSAMCDLFTSCILYQDTWQALCRCLAETCRGVEANQSYCTHLVPMCIQRCNQRNVEALVVLSSLVQNNKRNIQLFIDSNGGSLFTREFLQYETCLQLLATLVQSSSQATTLIGKSNITDDLRDFLQRYGPQSQLGKWATIILYHTSRSKVSSPSVIDKPSESINCIIPNQINIVPQENGDDTGMLFQNVLREILHWGPKGDLKDLQTFIPHEEKPNYDENVNLEAPIKDYNANMEIMSSFYDKNKISLKNNLQTSNITNAKPSNAKTGKPQVTDDYSFSFLHKKNVRSNIFSKYCDSQNFAKHAKVMNAQRNATTQTDSNLMQSSDCFNINREMYERSIEIVTDVIDFKPMFASTPKRDSDKSVLHQTRYSISKNTRKSIKQPVMQKQRAEVKNRIAKKKHDPKQEVSKFNKEIRNRSISTRFFDAINESCTTLVKTVKSMFVSKKNTPQNEDIIHTKAENGPSCNYSFTNYMRKRDAVLINEASKAYSWSDGFSCEASNSCNTCNNTLALKRKLANDEHLRNTVKKLKVGINLYGCDFKKISKTLWPRESYMTPTALYNLYRKLLIK